MKVWKYELPIADEFSLELPKGAKIIHAGQQESDHWCIWAVVDPDVPTESRTFRFAGTGHEIDELPEKLVHIASWQRWPFVWHAFEVLP